MSPSNSASTSTGGSRVAMLQMWAARCVTRYWMAILIAWIAAAITLRAIAPAWDSIAADGDLAFLPPDVTNSQGQEALKAAFPGEVSRSRLVIVMARQQGELTNGEVALSLDLARRLHWLSAKAAWEKIRQEHWDRLKPVDARDTEPARDSSESFEQGPPSTGPPNADVSSPSAIGTDVSVNEQSTSDPEDAPRAAETFSGNGAEASNPDESDAIRRYQASTVLVDTANDNLTQIIEIEDQLVDYLQRAQLDFEFRRLPDVYRMRGELLRRMGDQSQASIDLDLAELMREEATPTIDALDTEWSAQVLDVWTWRDDIVGHKLTDGRGQARLILIQLATELTATRNIQILEDIEAIIEELRADYAPLLSDQLRIEVSGSAAVGADMLRAAAGGVKQTEIVTVALVLLILAVVYRAPLLIAIPLLSISVSLVVALSVIALLARDPHDPSSWGIGVFTTSRIFIVVLLFGAGTDFCLFLLARSREMLRIHPAKNRRQVQRVIAGSWRSVHLALIASALTTIVGLAMMWFSDFEKFRYSGPTIAIALAITLLVCLTFTPALLTGLGRVAFWPLLRNADASSSSGPNDHPQSSRYWDRLAGYLVERPVHALCVTLGILIIPAIAGVLALDQVTYDLTDELSANATSRRGQQLIAKHFPSDDSTPITMVVKREQPFESEEDLRRAAQDLTHRLYVEGVDTVRSLSDPLGDYPPGKRMSLFSKEAWRRRILRNHRITHQRYISPRPELAQRVAKFDVTLKDNPFSLAADRTLADLQGLLERLTQDPQSAWYRSTVSATGTTVGISDLRRITQADQRRIQLLVTGGVWLVLVLLLRRVVLCTYLIFTVLLSYFATLGITYWTFWLLYSVEWGVAGSQATALVNGAGYAGLDWKVPLFLFVILVAVGQDYNVYLVTRIFEEQRNHSLREGVRRAVIFTGGIITSCGLVMAGTFIAMTSPAVFQWLSTWLPASNSSEFPVLRGLTELGFALSLGVLLDTLIVRSILVPAFIVFWQDKPFTRRK